MTRINHVSDDQSLDLVEVADRRQPYLQRAVGVTVVHRAVVVPVDAENHVEVRHCQEEFGQFVSFHTTQHTPTDHGRQRAKLQSDFMTPTYATYTPWL